MITITVDGKAVQAEEGASLLQTCLDNDIYVPNLCFLKEMTNPPAACRMCFVEIDGESQPVTSCDKKVVEGMAVRTDTDRVRRMQRTIFNLLFSAHHMDCKNCASRKGCQLQRIAKFLGVKLKARKLEELGRDLSQVPAHPCFELNPARCILCYKCLFVCNQKGHDLLTVNRKGFDTAVGYKGKGDEAGLPCPECGACVDICPVSAITPKKEEPKEASASA